MEIPKAYFVKAKVGTGYKMEFQVYQQLHFPLEKGCVLIPAFLQIFPKEVTQEMRRGIADSLQPPYISVQTV